MLCCRHWSPVRWKAPYVRVPIHRSPTEVGKIACTQEVTPLGVDTWDHRWESKRRKRPTPNQHAVPGLPDGVGGRRLPGDVLRPAVGDRPPIHVVNLHDAVAIAESMRPPNGAPNPLKPPHELYAEALLESDKPADALPLFERSLLRTPNRPLSLLGAARAHVALGNAEEATIKYGQLTEVWHDREMAALQEARQYLTAVGKKSGQ